MRKQPNYLFHLPNTEESLQLIKTLRGFLNKRSCRLVIKGRKKGEMNSVPINQAEVLEVVLNTIIFVKRRDGEFKRTIKTTGINSECWLQRIINPALRYIES